MKTKYLCLLTLIYSTFVSSQTTQLFNETAINTEIENQNTILKKSMIKFLNKVEDCNTKVSDVEKMRISNEKLEAQINKLPDNNTSINTTSRASTVSYSSSINNDKVELERLFKTVKSKFGYSSSSPYRITKETHGVVITIEQDELFKRNKLHFNADSFVNKLGNLLSNLKNKKLSIQIPDISGMERDSYLNKIELLNQKIESKYPQLKSIITIEQQTSLNKLFDYTYRPSTTKLRFVISN